jgi:hypothetical protein
MSAPVNRALLAVALAGLACSGGYSSGSQQQPPPHSSPDAGPPTLTSITPEEFVPDGGTPFAITALNVGTDTQVLFDGVAVPVTAQAQAPQLNGMSPVHAQGAGFVTLKNGDGQTSARVGVDFTWGADPARVTSCMINGKSGLTVPASAYMEFDALVSKSAVTWGTGQGPGIEVQFGIVPAAAVNGSWPWIAANYTGDYAAYVVAEDADEYAAYAPTTSGQYRFAFHARYLSGPWSWCEVDGMYPDMQPASLGVLTVQ